MEDVVFVRPFDGGANHDREDAGTKDGVALSDYLDCVGGEGRNDHGAQRLR